MSVTSINAATFAPVASFRANGVSAIGSTPAAAAAGASTAAAANVGSATKVDISSLGRLLSQVATFPGTNSTALQSVAAGASATADSSALVAATQRFFATVNTVQNELASSGNASLQNPQATLLGLTSLSSTDLLNLQSDLTLSGTSGAVAALANIGITFQQGNVGQATVDPVALQQALEANPAQTAALLTQVVTAAGQLAGDLVGNNSDPIGATSDLSSLGIALPAQFLLSQTNAAALQNALLDPALSGANVSGLTASAPDAASTQSSSEQSRSLTNSVTPAATSAKDRIDSSATTAIANNRSTTSQIDINAAAVAQVPAATTGNVQTVSATSATAPANTQGTTFTSPQRDALFQAVGANTAAAVAATYLGYGALGANRIAVAPETPETPIELGPVLKVTAVTPIRAIGVDVVA